MRERIEVWLWILVMLVREDQRLELGSLNDRFRHYNLTAVSKAEENQKDQALSQKSLIRAVKTHFGLPN
jgi:hypothetical protein